MTRQWISFGSALDQPTPSATWEAALREAVLDVLMVRFPGASLDEIRLRLASVHGEEMLRGLHREALQADSIRAFLHPAAKRSARRPPVAP